MNDKKNKYRVTSPIKYAGKRYEVGEELLLSAAEAEGVHVELAEQGAKKPKPPVGRKDSDDPEPPADPEPKEGKQEEKKGSKKK